MLDFSLVPALDANGVHTIIDLAKELGKSSSGDVDSKAKGTQLIVCGLVRRLEKAIRNASVFEGPVRNLIIEQDVDRALERCENELLRE